MKAVSKELGLCINTSKVKVMIIGLTGCLPRSDILKEYGKVGRFVYLGSTVQVSGGSLSEIRRRIALEEGADQNSRVSCVFVYGTNMYIECRWQKNK